MPFSDLIGHERQVATLRRALAKDRLHHAYLFVGPQGAGKRTLALFLAQALHCQRAGDDFCGACPPCQSIQSRNHPDVRLVEPLPGKKEISIQQIRELRREWALQSFSGKKKVRIIDPADLMNYAAQNSLLKTLEEPPGSALLVLITERSGALLPTVRSRCLRLGFAPPPLEAIAQLLVRKRGLPPDQARVLAGLVQGGVGEALSADLSEVVDERRGWLLRLASLQPDDYRGAMALAEAMAKDREECLKILQWVCGWYRDLLVYQATGSDSGVRNVDLVETLREHARLYSLAETLEIVARLSRLQAGIRRNFNRRLALEDMWMSVLQCLRAGPRESSTVNRQSIDE